MNGRIVFAGLMPHAPILVPGVGGPRLADAHATAEAMTTVARHALAAHPDTVVLISPHSPRQSGRFGLWHTPRLRGSLGRFGSPEDCVDLPADHGFAERLETEAGRRGLRIWHIAHEPLDHGALVPLCYLTAAGWKGPTVILSLNFPGEGELDELGQAIAAAAQALGRRTAVIASGDLSHRLTLDAPAGYDPDARRFDERFMELLRAGRFDALRNIDPELQEAAAEDAVDATRVAAAAAAFSAEGHTVLSYEGPFGVGYGVAILFEPAATPANPPGVIAHFTDLPAVARRAVASNLVGPPAQPPVPPAGELDRPGAVFVTVRTVDGDLRGCRGVTRPVERDIVAETWHSALAAALHDPRFPPVTAGELPRLRFTVTVLGELEPVPSSAGLDPAVYGVLVAASDGRKAVLLPGIEGVDTVEQQLAIVRQKAGIAPGEGITIQRFRTRCFEEHAAVPAGPSDDES
jgi:AMMECR1 domain-containing protein/aromatic ring-opening dioxygenase LigB subunit